MRVEMPPTILVVEDEVGVRQLMEEYLAVLEYRVISAGSAEEALSLLESHVPDLVITDVRMSGMSGIDLCTWLKSHPRHRFTPVIIVTAGTDLASRVAGLAAGADDFFGKPVDLSELQARLRSLLRIKTLQDDLEEKNELLRTVFGRYVSEGVADEIIRKPSKHLGLGGEKREVTILFADLRGFTPLADTLEPEDVVDVLNGYLSHVIDAVFEFGGTLDKFFGDGIMALFGAPVAHEDDPARAVRCALRLQEVMQTLHFPKFPDLRLNLGIGIHTGVAVVGNIGSERRMDYTAIGGAVNLAQRFEASAGPGQILITDATYEHVRSAVQVRELGLLRLSGVAQGVMAFDVLGAKPS